MISLRTYSFRQRIKNIFYLNVNKFDYMYMQARPQVLIIYTHTDES